MQLEIDLVFIDEDEKGIYIMFIPLEVTKTCYSLQKMLDNRRRVAIFYYNDGALTVIESIIG